jgi:hypothetical protein
MAASSSVSSPRELVYAIWYSNRDVYVPKEAQNLVCEWKQAARKTFDAWNTQKLSSDEHTRQFAQHNQPLRHLEQIESVIKPRHFNPQNQGEQAAFERNPRCVLAYTVYKDAQDESGTVQALAQMEAFNRDYCNLHDLLGRSAVKPVLRQDKANYRLTDFVVNPQLAAGTDLKVRESALKALVGYVQRAANTEGQSVETFETAETAETEILLGMGFVRSKNKPFSSVRERSCLILPCQKTDDSTKPTHWPVDNPQAAAAAAAQ